MIWINKIETAIREKLIPALVGKPVSELEREVLSVPYRHGGLGLQNPVETADREYHTSRKITEGLTQLIMAQNMDIQGYDQVKTKEIKSNLKAEKEGLLKEKVLSLKMRMQSSELRYFECAQEKGASSWLSALPLKSLGYTLNKQEFRDAVCLRYGWNIEGIPRVCSCGKSNDLDHTLICHKGGFVNMRHDALRNAEAKLMEKVCKDVQIEPRLLPVNPDHFSERTNTSPNARLDISARGVYGDGDKTFFDVRVTHPNTPSSQGKSLTQIYNLHENEKKSEYSDRVLNVEKGTFVPLVFTTSGGMGPECLKLNKRIAEKTSEKTNELYSQVMMHVRTRLRFAMLKSTLVGLRGYRGKKAKAWDEEEDVAYNLIPYSRCYESK